jgi:hypothetical protein
MNANLERRLLVFLAGGMTVGCEEESAEENECCPREFAGFGGTTTNLDLLVNEGDAVERYKIEIVLTKV